MIKSRRIRWAVYVAYTGEKKAEYRILVDKSQSRRPRRWTGNIKMSLREIGWVGVDWTRFTQDRDQWRALADTMMNLRVP
jgi:hypothetical protein